jgi:hypothetical protein
MTSARFLVGDVFERMAELPDHSVDLILTSPPFLALRSYLPDGHPDKTKEIGSEPTPAAFLDTMLALTAEWRRLLAPHGSIAIEIGDTYSGSGGAGGDYDNGNVRAAQPRFAGSGSKHRMEAAREGTNSRLASGPGWPLAKSLALIPELYAASLAYGRNLLTGEPSPAGMWRVRNIKPWIRSNPPVGALGDKERPATSYVTVATVATDRYFDLDAVRTTPSGNSHGGGTWTTQGGDAASTGEIDKTISNPAGAPPLDWFVDADAVIDAEIDRRAGKDSGAGLYPGDPVTPGRLGAGDGTNNGGQGRATRGAISVGARGVHIRRALENAGILTTHDALDVSPRGYAGAHYAVWPPELVRQLVDEMCPRHVCTTCGQPSRRIVDSERTIKNPPSKHRASRNGQEGGTLRPFGEEGHTTYTTLGWSDCGCPGPDMCCDVPIQQTSIDRWRCNKCGSIHHHPDGLPQSRWRPGHVLDPFVGSGTTLAVCTGMARDATGIDLDSRNADLALERVGIFLDIDHGTTEAAS